MIHIVLYLLWFQWRWITAHTFTIYCMLNSTCQIASDPWMSTCCDTAAANSPTVDYSPHALIMTIDLTCPWTRAPRVWVIPLHCVRTVAPRVPLRATFTDRLSLTFGACPPARYFSGVKRINRRRAVCTQLCSSGFGPPLQVSIVPYSDRQRGMDCSVWFPDLVRCCTGG